jgi:hypothetical protein
MSDSRRTWPLWVAALAAVVFLFGELREASAQSTSAQATSKSHKAPAKRAAPPPQRITPPSSEVSDGRDYWSIDYSALNQYKAEHDRTPRASNLPELRKPLQTGPGSIGIETNSRVSSTRLYDGSVAPGLTANTQKESSFVGLSLTVPSNSKVLPIPVPTPWNRTE